MKYYTFYRDSNNFKDILEDSNITSEVATKIIWLNHLLLGFKNTTPDSVLGYIVLKYGDELINLCNKDYTPVIDVDYIPKKN